MTNPPSWKGKAGTTGEATGCSKVTTGAGRGRGEVRRLGLSQERTNSPGGHKGPSKLVAGRAQVKGPAGTGGGKEGGLRGGAEALAHTDLFP